LFRIDTASKAILQTVRLTGATNVDWEELTFDGTYFYVGDFGNNLNGARTDLKIYKFPYSSIPDYLTTPQADIPREQIEIINFTYKDQQNRVAAGLDATKFDCEAMIVSEGKIDLFTKDWIDFTSTHYVINSTLPGSYVATPVDTLDTDYLVTAASKVPGQEVVVLLGYQNSFPGNHYMHLLTGYSEGKYFNGNKRKINLPNAATMGQAEGITFKNDNYGYISNEKLESSFVTVWQKLYSFNIGSLIPSNILTTQLNNFSVDRVNAAVKIEWLFNSPVHNLQVEQSPNGVHFHVLQTYNVSTEGTFYNKPETSLNYYRISWQENNTVTKYSKIISIDNLKNKRLRNVLLKANGELSFVLGGSQEEFFLFKLLSTDGKELSQVTGRSYKPGVNKINFTGSSALNRVVLVTAYGSKQKIPMLLHVLK
ncbi:MAG TPA: hypothetical protein VK369_04750, partial [Segetibacter sp.]|nr:hypothetical protein [Segetibacter sp.]